MVLVGLSVIAVLLVVGFVGFFAERRSWNHGKCPKCDTNWSRFDSDSQGGRGYKCKGCEKYIWISYPFIDTYHKGV